MDPVTGIGLAASVIQLVTFSIQVVGTVREVYEQGSVTRYDDLSNTTDHLGNLTQSLQQCLPTASRQMTALSKDEKDLLDLGRKCQKCAQKLRHELQKLQSQPQSSKLTAARIALRAVRKSSEIEGISKALSAYRATLETSLLHSLSQRYNAQGLQNEERFMTLDTRLQHVVACLATSRTSLAEITALESEQTRSQITAAIQKLERLHVDHRKYDEIIKSLFYSDIFSRQEQVDDIFEGIKDSYKWIFKKHNAEAPLLHDKDSELKQDLDGSADLDHGREITDSATKLDVRAEPEDGGNYCIDPQDNFSQWLRSEQKLYWINGKAGSGKSTLMNYICQDYRRLELLRDWSADRLLLTTVYFFWSAGSRLQKSIDGLLRSLLYQILTKCDELTYCLENEPLHAWTEARLMTAVLSMLKQPRIPIAVCLFIDGLDEIEDRHERLVKLIVELTKQSNIKICLSSRPLLSFVQAFRDAPSLKLQDLTCKAIEAYARHRLVHSIDESGSTEFDDPALIHRLAHMIVDRADGVFLWAVIAIRNVRDGLQGIADSKELLRTIDDLPCEIEELFSLMLNRIKPAYQKDAATFFQIALLASSPTSGHGFPLTLGGLYFTLSQQKRQDEPLHYERLAESEIMKACNILRTRLVSHTAGLLESTGATQEFSYDSREVARFDEPLLATRIQFLHRTTRDFFRENTEAQTFLARLSLGKAQIHRAIARGKLVRLMQSPDGSIYRRSISAYSSFDIALHHIAACERLEGAAQIHLMGSLQYHPYAQGYSRPYHPYRELSGDSEKAYVINDYGSMVDPVGFAAHAGMTLYVMKRLRIPNVAQHLDESLPDSKNYLKRRCNFLSLVWQIPDQIAQYEKRLLQSSSSTYSCILQEHLRRAEHPATDDLGGNNNMLVATYLLACCEPTCYSLAQSLLHAGANPMAVVSRTVPDKYHQLKCFWQTWLELLISFLRDHIHCHGVSGDILIDKKYQDQGLTTAVAFETTKILISHGADIDFKISQRKGLFRRETFEGCGYDFRMKLNAMYVLTQCFSRNPELHSFAKDMEPSVPSKRKICKVERDDDYDEWHYYVKRDDSQTLSPLINRWEKTGLERDRKVLIETTMRIWEARELDWIKNSRIVALPTSKTMSTDLDGLEPKKDSL